MTARQDGKPPTTVAHCRRQPNQRFRHTPADRFSFFQPPAWHGRASGVGRGVTPRPQPQTGRASFQASGFPTDSKLFVPSEFSACGSVYTISEHCPAYVLARNWQIVALVWYGLLPWREKFCEFSLQGVFSCVVSL